MSTVTVPRVSPAVRKTQAQAATAAAWGTASSATAAATTASETKLEIKTAAPIRSTASIATAAAATAAPTAAAVATASSAAAVASSAPVTLDALESRGFVERAAPSKTSALFTAAGVKSVSHHLPAIDFEKSSITRNVTIRSPPISMGEALAQGVQTPIVWELTASQARQVYQDKVMFGATAAPARPGEKGGDISRVRPQSATLTKIRRPAR